MAQEIPYSRPQVYLGNSPQEPKQMFLDLFSKIASHVGERDFSLLDVGAATGDFIHFATRHFPNLEAQGIEYDSSLVAEAHRRGFGKVIKHGDANDLNFIAANSYDIVTLTGTHSIFDDFRPSLSECLRVAKGGGLVLVTGIFNPYPVDAKIHWRYAGNFTDGWHPGYNLFSIESVSQFLRQQVRAKSFSFSPFTFHGELQPSEDPIRSWTCDKAESASGLRNGIMPLNFFILSIEVESPWQDRK